MKVNAEDSNAAQTPDVLLQLPLILLRLLIILMSSEVPPVQMYYTQRQALSRSSFSDHYLKSCT
ncbi:hypothetical protein [Coleofasciculus sp. B1-GNL1-01]|uniref:hypothetical protein n=1 Tax=Coleofasciculus sp. B1-GNL1-01 TaxID=3068484 RepID=UPI00406492AD